MSLKGKAAADLTTEEIQQMKTEYDLYQSMSTNQSGRGVPFLPSFSGDDKGAEYGYWKEAIQSLRSMKYDDKAILQSIRKSISGTAAKVIGCLPFSSSVDKVLAGLDVSFGDLKNDATNWQRF